MFLFCLVAFLLAVSLNNLDICMNVEYFHILLVQLYCLLDLDNLSSNKQFIVMMLTVLFTLLFLHDNVAIPVQNTTSSVSI